MINTSKIRLHLSYEDNTGESINDTEAAEWHHSMGKAVIAYIELFGNLPFIGLELGADADIDPPRIAGIAFYPLGLDLFITFRLS